MIEDERKRICSQSKKERGECKENTVIKYELYSTIDVLISKEWSVSESIQKNPFFAFYFF